MKRFDKSKKHSENKYVLIKNHIVPLIIVASRQFVRDECSHSGPRSDCYNFVMYFGDSPRIQSIIIKLIFFKLGV